MRVHTSRIDRWLLAVLAVSALMSLSAAIVVLDTGSLAAVFIAAVIAGIGAGLPLSLLLSTRYVIDHSQLRVQSGPFRWRIPLAAITAVVPSSSPLSSPALSLDRPRIDYGRGASILISPRDKAGFLADLEAARGAAGQGHQRAAMSR